jgi:hypothetical protein
VVCVVVVSVLEESVAVSTQVPVALMLKALKVAVPAAATPVVVPPRVQFDVMVIVSVDPVPAVTGFALTSSTETLNVGRMVEAVVSVAGGAVVKASWVGAPAATKITVLVATANVLDESVATSWQLLPVLIVTAVNVATPATAVTLVVPARAHADVNVMMSVDPVPAVMGIPLLSSTETPNEGSTVPAVTADAGCVVKPTSAGVLVATLTAALTAAVKPVSPTEVSVADKTQLDVPAVNVAPVKVATPAVAAPLTVALNVHPAEGVIRMVSVDAPPEVTTFP